MRLNEADQKALDRSIEAQRIIDDPVVVGALAKMRQDILDKWESGCDNPEQREEMHRMIKTLDNFIDTFDLYLNDAANARIIMGLMPVEKTFFQKIQEWLS